MKFITLKVITAGATPTIRLAVHLWRKDGEPSLEPHVPRS